MGTATCRKPTALVVCPQARHLPSLSPSPPPMEGRHELRATAGLDFGHSSDPSLPDTPLMIGQLIPMDNVLLQNRTRLIPSQEACTHKSLRGEQRLQQLLSASRSACTLAGGQSQPRGAHRLQLVSTAPSGPWCLLCEMGPGWLCGRAAGVKLRGCPKHALTTRWSYCCPFLGPCPAVIPGYTVCGGHPWPLEPQFLLPTATFQDNVCNQGATVGTGPGDCRQ